MKALNARKEAWTFKAHVGELPGVRPESGFIEMRFKTTPGHEALIQAIELIP